MQAQQTQENNINSNESLSFEKVWAMFQETDKKFQETDKKFQELREQMKETDRQMKETDRQMKETNRRIGELGNRFGELAEHLVAPSTMEKFNEYGFNFTKRSENVEIWDDSHTNLIAEVDIMLENGDVVIVVEVKSKPVPKDIEDHIKRMEVLRKKADSNSDKRKYRGAIAGAIINQNMRMNIIQNGFYLIEQTGDTVELTIPPGFIPREW